MPYEFDPDALAIVPEGTHLMTVDEIKEVDSSKGDPMWIVSLLDKNDVEVSEFIVHKPKIIDWKFRPLWEAAGLTWPEGRAVLDEHQLVGKQVMVTIKHEKSQQYGLQARVDGYDKPTATELDDGRKDFPLPTEQTVPAGADDDDDDIPF